MRSSASCSAELMTPKHAWGRGSKLRASGAGGGGRVRGRSEVPPWRRSGDNWASRRYVYGGVRWQPGRRAACSSARRSTSRAARLRCRLGRGPAGRVADVSRTCRGRGRVAGESWTCRGRVAGVSRGLGGAIRSSGGGARHRAQHKEVPEAKPGRQGGEHASVPAGGESCAAGASGRAGTRLGELPDKEGPVRLDQAEAGGDAAVRARPVHLEGVVGVQQRLRAAGKTSRGTARKARRGRVPDTSRARRGGKSSITHRCISAASRLHLGCISAASRLHLAERRSITDRPRSGSE